MTLKTVLYYSLVGRWGDGRGYRVLAVTSESRNRINGRFDDNEATHCTRRDLVGKFETFAAADAKINNVVAIRKEWEPKIKAAYDAARSLDDAEHKAIRAELDRS